MRDREEQYTKISRIGISEAPSLFCFWTIDLAHFLYTAICAVDVVREDVCLCRLFMSFCLFLFVFHHPVDFEFE